MSFQAAAASQEERGAPKPPVQRGVLLGCFRMLRWGRKGGASQSALIPLPPAHFVFVCKDFGYGSSSQHERWVLCPRQNCRKVWREKAGVPSCGFETSTYLNMNCLIFASHEQADCVKRCSGQIQLSIARLALGGFDGMQSILV